MKKLFGLLLIIITLCTLSLYNIYKIQEDELTQIQQQLQNTQQAIDDTEQYIAELREFMDKLEVMEVEATAYTHTGNPTYTGTMPSRGTIAVDPSRIPLGTRLFVQGYGWATAEDTGSKIKNNKIDLFMDTKEECLKWGVCRTIVIRIK